METIVSTEQPAPHRKHDPWNKGTPDRPEAGLSVSRQYTLLGVARSGFYYRQRPESAEELELLKRLDRIFTDCPVYGSRRLQVALLREGISTGRRRVRRLMRKLGLWAVRPKRNTSKRHPGHKVYPYLLRGKTIDRANQVWAADITYIPMRQGFLYLVESGLQAAPTACPCLSRN